MTTIRYDAGVVADAVIHFHPVGELPVFKLCMRQLHERLLASGGQPEDSFALTPFYSEGVRAAVMGCVLAVYTVERKSQAALFRKFTRIGIRVIWIQRFGPPLRRVD